MQINRSLLGTYLRMLLAEPVTWIQSVIFQWLMLKVFALLFLMAGSRGRPGFPDVYLLLGGTALWMLMSIVSASRILSHSKATGVSEAVLVSPVSMLALLDTSVAACVIFNTAQAVIHCALLAHAHPGLLWNMPMVSLLCGFCLSTALLLFLAREIMASDGKSVPLNAFLAGSVMVCAVLLIACTFTGVRISRIEIIFAGLLCAGILLLTVWAVGKGLMVSKSENRSGSVHSVSGEDKHYPIESMSTWSAMSVSEDSAGDNCESASFFRYMFYFFRKYFASVIRMPFVYVMGILPVSGAWLLVQLSSARMDVPVSVLGQEFVRAGYGLLGLILLISSYQCALHFISEEKNNSIMSELICSPANMHSVFLGRAAGIAAAIVGICLVVSCVEIIRLMPSFLKGFVFEPRMADMICLSFLYAVLFSLCALAGEGRHYANIALVSIPVGEIMIAKVLPLSIKSGGAIFMAKYSVMVLIAAGLYGYFLSGSRLLSEGSQQ